MDLIVLTVIVLCSMLLPFVAAGAALQMLFMLMNRGISRTEPAVTSSEFKAMRHIASAV